MNNEVSKKKKVYLNIKSGQTDLFLIPKIGLEIEK